MSGSEPTGAHSHLWLPSNCSAEFPNIGQPSSSIGVGIMGKKAPRPKTKENQRKPKRRRGRTGGYREKCQRRRMHEQEAPARVSVPNPLRAVPARLDLAVGVGADAPGADAGADAGAGAGAGAGAAVVSAARSASSVPLPPKRALQEYDAPQWRVVEAPKTASAFGRALKRAVRVFEAWTSAAPPECHALGDFVVFSRGAPGMFHYCEQGYHETSAYDVMPRHVRVARTSMGELRFVNLVNPPQAAAVCSVQVAIFRYCEQADNGSLLLCTGGRWEFPELTVDLDACVTLGNPSAHGPCRARFIFQFDHRHRSPEQLQRLVCEYFADMYVSAVLIMKAYKPCTSGQVACFAILYTRGEAGGVPRRAWDLGAQGLHDQTKRAFGLGASGNAGQDALGGVPAAMWVRHACAPVPTFDGSARMAMHYDEPPMCSVDARHFFYIPDGGYGLLPKPMPTQPLVIDLGAALGAFLVALR